MKAALEQVSAAKQVIHEAQQISQNTSDPKKKEALENGIQHAEIACDKVIHSAERVSSNPLDSSAQRDLQQDQNDLADAVAQLGRAALIGAPSNQSNAEFEKAVSDLKPGQSANPIGNNDEFYALIQSSMKSAQDIIAQAGNMGSTPQEILASAKAIAEKINALVKILNEKAKSCEDPVCKEQLTNCGKVLRDNATQLKILAAVNLTAHNHFGEAAYAKGSGDQVIQASKNLCVGLNQALNAVSHATLKQNVKSTNSKTSAIKRLLASWRKAVK